MITGEGQDSDEQVGVVVEAGERVCQFVADLRGERVLLLDPVDRDHQDVVVDDLGADLAVGVAGAASVSLDSIMERRVPAAVA